MEDYEGHGICLKEVASGFRFQAIPETAKWLSRMWEEKPPKYSRATLETLALMAYRQPITRSEIEDIRGVSVSSNIVKSLMERDWIKVVGHRDVPGKPALYATTKDFLDYFDLKSLEELPPLSEIKNLDEIEIQDMDPEAEQEIRSGDVDTIAELASDIAQGRTPEQTDTVAKETEEETGSVLDEEIDFSHIDKLNAEINTDTSHIVEEVVEAVEQSAAVDEESDKAVAELEESVQRVEDEVEAEPS
jgi:segregation and condensation protein B